MALFGLFREQRLKDFTATVSQGRVERRFERGLVVVPVNQIVGSVGKAGSMNRRFRYLSGKVDARLRSLRKANEFGMCAFPPVELYQIGDEYFVVDGHHRVALALENRQPDIDALVTTYELSPAGGLPPAERRPETVATGRVSAVRSAG